MTGLTGGVTTWTDARTGPLAGATCLWQDLDGLHVEPAPPTPPLTSIVWGWTADGALLRARIDGETVYLAVRRGDGTVGTPLQPWAANDDRVAAHRAAAATTSYGLGTAYEHLIVDADDDGVGPVSFVRPAGPRHER